MGGGWPGGWDSRGRVQRTQAGGDKGEARAGRNPNQVTGFELGGRLGGLCRKRPGGGTPGAARAAEPGGHGRMGGGGRTEGAGGRGIGPVRGGLLEGAAGWVHLRVDLRDRRGALRDGRGAEP